MSITLIFYFLLMKRKLPIFILLFVFAAGFYSCLYKEAIEAPAAELQEEIIPDDGEFSILSAKTFFDNKIPGFRLLNLDEEAVDNDAVTRSIVDARVLTPEWTKGRRYVHDGRHIVDVPVNAEERVWARRKKVDPESGRLVTEKTLALSKLMFTVDPSAGDTTVLMATIVPEYAYTRAKLYTVSAVESIPTTQNFSGHVFYSDLYGKFVRGRVYKEGKVTGQILLNPLLGHGECGCGHGGECDCGEVCGCGHGHDDHSDCDDPGHGHAYHDEQGHYHYASVPEGYEPLIIVIGEDAVYTRSQGDNASCDPCEKCGEVHGPTQLCRVIVTPKCERCKREIGQEDCPCCPVCLRIGVHREGCYYAENPNPTQYCDDCLWPKNECKCPNNPTEPENPWNPGGGEEDDDDDPDDPTNPNGPNIPQMCYVCSPAVPVANCRFYGRHPAVTPSDTTLFKIKILNNEDDVMDMMSKISLEDCLGSALMNFIDDVTTSQNQGSISVFEPTPTEVGQGYYKASDRSIRLADYGDGIDELATFHEVFHLGQNSGITATRFNSASYNMEAENLLATYIYAKQTGLRFPFEEERVTQALNDYLQTRDYSHLIEALHNTVYHIYYAGGTLTYDPSWNTTSTFDQLSQDCFNN